MAWNMRIRRKISVGNKLPLGSLFWIGVLAGIIVMNLAKSILLDGTGLLDEYTLYHMKYMTVDSGALFYYILWLRMKTAIILIVFAVFDILNSQTDGRVDRARGTTIMTHLECIKAHILELVDNSTDVDLLDLILKLLIHESCD